MAANESWLVEIAFASQPDAAIQIYTDVTTRVDTAKSLIVIAQGDTAETTDEGSLTLVLNNSDQAFTPGNTLSPYYPNMKSARRIRVTEVIGSYRFVLFTGYIEFPDITAWTASTASAPRDQQITFTATDRMTRLANARPFLSTLGEHIAYSGTPAAYWPLVGTIGVNPATTTQAPLTVTTVYANVDATANAAATAGGGSSITADDIATFRLAPNIVGSVFAIDKYLRGPITPISITSSTFTAVWWMYVEDVAGPGGLWNFQNSTLEYLQLAGGSTVMLQAAAGPTFVNIAAQNIPTYKWTLVALRMTLPSGLVELWIDDDAPTTGTLGGGVVPSTVSFDDVFFANNMQGNIAYLQVYTGDYTREQFLAQYHMGLEGLEYQTTGQRIRTVLAYAGVPAMDMNRVDRGVSVMQRASLAGKTPATLLTEASDTERGSLYVAGDGQMVFADRKRLYNI